MGKHAPAKSVVISVTVAVAAAVAVAKSVVVSVAVVVAVVEAVALFGFGLSGVLFLFGFCLGSGIVTGVLLDSCVADLSQFVVSGAPVASRIFFACCRASSVCSCVVLSLMSTCI